MVIAVPPDWRDEQTNGYFVKLRRHLLACVECKGARTASIPEHMCLQGRALTLSAADGFDIVMDLRRRATSHGSGLIYACPDLSLHGKSYVMTAQLYNVVGINEGLF